jgi:hypothetical protein
MLEFYCLRILLSLHVLFFERTNLLVSFAPSELLRDKQLASLGEFDKCFICPLIMVFLAQFCCHFPLFIPLSDSFLCMITTFGFPVPFYVCVRVCRCKEKLVT